jgi:hypothetical protein
MDPAWTFSIILQEQQVKLCMVLEWRLWQACNPLSQSVATTSEAAGV